MSHVLTGFLRKFDVNVYTYSSIPTASVTGAIPMGC